MRKIRSLILLILLAVLLCGAVQAQETEYIFRLRRDAVMPRSLSLAQCETVYAPEGIFLTDDAELIEELQLRGLLDLCAANDTVTLMDLPIPTEELQALSWPRALTGYHGAAESGVTGKGIRVAVIDSGLSDPNEEFRAATVDTGINFLADEDTDARLDVSDNVGHGTNVCRMIASTTLGLAPEVTLIPLKCFDAKTSSIAAVVSAIYTAVDEYDCHVINMSFGTLTENPLLAAAVTHGLEQGVIMVAAAGNLESISPDLHQEVSLYRYPASQEGVISVGALGQDKQIGTHSVRNDKVLIAAPGSALPTIHPTTGANTLGTGTSFAAPFVTAAAALALSQDPDLTGEEFRTLLAATAEDLGTEGVDIYYGHGMLNVGLLLSAQRQDPAPTITFDGSRYYASAWRGAADLRTCVAAYEAGGKFLYTYLFEQVEELFLSNFPLPEEAARYHVISFPGA